MSAAREMEMFDNVMKNYSQAVLTFRNQEEEDAKKLEVFLGEMRKVFEFIDSIDYSNANQLMTKHFDPSNLAVSVMLVADAAPIERFLLKRFRSLLLNRLNSYTKNKKLIYDILVEYFMKFIDCLEGHAGNTLMLRQMMLLSALGIQTDASQSFVRFIQGPLAIAMAEKKHELEKMTKNLDKSQGGWKAGAVK